MKMEVVACLLINLGMTWEKLKRKRKGKVDAVIYGKGREQHNRYNQ